MKGKLEFDLDDCYDRNAFKRAVKATDVYMVLHEVVNKLFRPSWKNGYTDKELDTLSNTEEGDRVIEILSEMYREILEEYNIDLNDLD